MVGNISPAKSTQFVFKGNIKQFEQCSHSDLSINAALSKYKEQSPKGATGNKYVHLCIIQKIYMYPTYITN